MTKETFQLCYDPETKFTYVKKVVDEIQKNHQECDNEIITGFMPQMLDTTGIPHKMYPVRVFENYINNLHPDNKFLWQKLKKYFPKYGIPWYNNIKVGHNTHEKFMSKLSEDAKLSKRYTNHCVRVTGITSLTRDQFTPKQITSITGHKSVESLAVYQRVKSDEKLMMGMLLTFSLLYPEDVIMTKNCIEPKQVPPLPAPPQKTSMVAMAETVNTTPKVDNTTSLIPLDNAIVPYQPPKNNETPHFDLMSLLADVENKVPDEDLVLAATQCEEASLALPLKNTTPVSTTNTTVMKRVNNPAPTFTNCTFGSIGTLNIHIHKH